MLNILQANQAGAFAPRTGPRRTRRRSALHTLWFGAALVASCVALGGCATNPVTGHGEFRLVSEAQEIHLGRESFANMSQAQGGELTAFPRVGAYVSRVGRALVKVSDRPTLPYEFKVLNNEVPNAWTLPGGKIAVNRGLLVELQNEAELAAVLSHEIVHAAARHGAKSLERGMLLQAGVLGLGFAVDNHDYQDLILGSAGISAQLVGLKYSREAEREADYYGMKYMAAAGYDPAAAVTLQETFVRLAKGGQGGWMEGLFASHPPSRERVEANRRVLAQFPRGGRLGEEAYAAAIGPLRDASAAYEKQSQGYRALRKGDSRRALQLAREAQAEAPDEASFYGLAAKALAASGDTMGAGDMLDEAIARDGQYFDYYLQRGLLEQAQGQTRAARKDLSRSLRLLPTAQGHYALGRVELDDDRVAAARTNFRRAASTSSEAGREARVMLTRLDLPRQPHEFIQVLVERNRKGYLELTAVNRGVLAVRDIRIEVEIYQDNRTYRTSVSLPEVLMPKASATAITRVGPFVSDEWVRETVRIHVVSAAVAE